MTVQSVDMNEGDINTSHSLAFDVDWPNYLCHYEILALCSDCLFKFPSFTFTWSSSMEIYGDLH